MKTSMWILRKRVSINNWSGGILMYQVENEFKSRISSSQHLHNQRILPFLKCSVSIWLFFDKLLLFELFHKTFFTKLIWTRRILTFLICSYANLPEFTDKFPGWNWLDQDSATSLYISSLMLTMFCYHSSYFNLKVAILIS